jgi:hypothetical protein
MRLESAAMSVFRPPYDTASVTLVEDQDVVRVANGTDTESESAGVYDRISNYRADPNNILLIIPPHALKSIMFVTAGHVFSSAGIPGNFRSLACQR